MPPHTSPRVHEGSANRGVYGSSNVTGRAGLVASSLTGSPLAYVRPGAASTYLFADGVHPTSAAHQMLGQYAISILEGPRLQQILTHSAQTIGRSRADQVSLHQAGRPADGMSWWGGVRGDMQRYDHADVYDGLAPAGLFCRALEGCRAVQLERCGRLDPAMKILLANLDLLARRDWRLLRQKCQLEQDDLLDMLAEIQALNPRPGFDPRHPVTLIQPDLTVRRNGDGFRLTFNHRALPRCHVDTDIQRHIDSSTETGRQLQTYASEASAVIRALEMRRQTILKVGAEIIRQQAAFFEDGISALRPLTMRELATTTDVHESTISRVVNGKYMDTPRGIVPLRMFFSTALQASDGSVQSASAIQHRLRALIAAEGDDILSDDALTTLLQKEGFAIQRRTVAKYREGLGIAKSSQRRRLKKTS